MRTKQIHSVPAKIHRISPQPQDSMMRKYELTLKNVDSSPPCHRIEADYFGNAMRIQCGLYKSLLLVLFVTKLSLSQSECQIYQKKNFFFV